MTHRYDIFVMHLYCNGLVGMMRIAFLFSGLKLYSWYIPEAEWLGGDTGIWRLFFAESHRLGLEHVERTPVNQLL